MIICISTCFKEPLHLSVQMSSAKHFLFYVSCFMFPLPVCQTLYLPSAFKSISEGLSTEVTIYHSRSRRSPETSLPVRLPTELVFDNTTVNLNLIQNLKLQKLEPHFRDVNGRIVKIFKPENYNKVNQGFYHDVSRQASFHVECIQSCQQLTLTGTFQYQNKIFLLSSMGYERKLTYQIHSISSSFDIEATDGSFDLHQDTLKEYRKSATRKSRKRRATDTYTIELFIVVDYSVFEFWMNESNQNRTLAIYRINTYYAFLVNGVDLRYKTIPDSAFSIGFIYSGIYIAQTPAESYWTEDNKFVTPSGEIQIETEATLANFSNWVQRNAGFLSRPDHTILFTKYQLVKDGTTPVYGQTFQGAMCSTNSQSVIVDRFDFISQTVAAHEIGHSLGATHDGDQNTCNKSASFIMSSASSARQGDVSNNPWFFSTCSVAEMQSFINSKNSNGPNCLLVTNAQSIISVDDYLKRPLGQEFDLDEQCQLVFGPTSYAERALYQKNFQTICTGLWCHVGGDDLTLVIPAEGTSCGSTHWCSGYQCVSNSNAPSRPANCIHGDTPFNAVNGQTCQMFVESQPWVCYQDHVFDTCCQSCLNQQIQIQDCAYGDRISGCDVTNCTASTNTELCCGTCANQPQTTTQTPSNKDCPYGDSTLCVESLCPYYVDLSACCNTCKDYLTTLTASSTATSIILHSTTHLSTTTTHAMPTEEETQQTTSSKTDPISSTSSIVTESTLKETTQTEFTTGISSKFTISSESSSTVLPEYLTEMTSVDSLTTVKSTEPFFTESSSHKVTPTNTVSTAILKSTEITPTEPPVVTSTKTRDLQLLSTDSSSKFFKSTEKTSTKSTSLSAKTLQISTTEETVTESMSTEVTNSELSAMQSSTKPPLSSTDSISTGMTNQETNSKQSSTSTRTYLSTIFTKPTTETISTENNVSSSLSTLFRLTTKGLNVISTQTSHTPESTVTTADEMFTESPIKSTIAGTYTETSTKTTIIGDSTEMSTKPTTMETFPDTSTQTTVTEEITEASTQSLETGEITEFTTRITSANNNFVSTEETSESTTTRIILSGLIVSETGDEWAITVAITIGCLVLLSLFVFIFCLYKRRQGIRHRLEKTTKILTKRDKPLRSSMGWNAALSDSRRPYVQRNNQRNVVQRGTDISYQVRPDYNVIPSLQSSLAPGTDAQQYPVTEGNSQIGAHISDHSYFVDRIPVSFTNESETGSKRGADEVQDSFNQKLETEADKTIETVSIHSQTTTLSSESVVTGEHNGQFESSKQDRMDRMDISAEMIFDKSDSSDADYQDGETTINDVDDVYEEDKKVINDDEGKRGLERNDSYTILKGSIRDRRLMLRDKWLQEQQLRKVIKRRYYPKRRTSRRSRHRFFGMASKYRPEIGNVAFQKIDSSEINLETFKTSTPRLIASGTRSPRPSTMSSPRQWPPSKLSLDFYARSSASNSPRRSLTSPRSVSSHSKSTLKSDNFLSKPIVLYTDDGDEFFLVSKEDKPKRLRRSKGHQRLRKTEYDLQL